MIDRMYLDAPSLVYRAFFALPKTIRDPQGRSVNAVRGFMEMTTRLLTDRRPREVVAVFDADWRPAFRVEAYAGYKSERQEDPPELPRQFDVLAEVLDTAGIVRAEAAGLEADDVLATLVARKPPEEQAAIVSGDRDLLALVRDPDIVLLFPVKGVSELTVFDESAVEEKYGVPPSLYPQFAILRGDSSDGLPGVAGIGPVRGVKLLREFGSVDAILENLATLPPKQALAFDQARDYLEAMKTVVGLVPDAEVEMTEAHQPNDDALHELGEIHGLKSSSARLARAVAGGSQGGAR
ncbi:MAG: 5'-3' exonuclease [Actinomycetota bacterium]|nr:5'-3' exonuclease [Actinomycetota bacterium]